MDNLIGIGIAMFIGIVLGIYAKKKGLNLFTKQKNE